MKNTTGQPAPVEARDDNPVRGGEMGSAAIQCKPAEFSKMVKIQEAKNQITTTMRHSQPVLDFCPSQNKHFFCGMAKKLGCHFCANLAPREESPFLEL